MNNVNFKATSLKEREDLHFHERITALEKEIKEIKQAATSKGNVVSRSYLNILHYAEIEGYNASEKNTGSSLPQSGNESEIRLASALSSLRNKNLTSEG